MDLQFDWDDDKRVLNLEKHKIDFFDAISIFRARTLDRSSNRNAEARVVSIGRMRERVIAVVWTQREGVRRIISARVARHEEVKDYENLA
ncbi:BrnT family toxin [Roseiterribacter gracilis]|uniref:BrnT family toxin n=1 Tax=Roseiterribacter gracilis TaxID=2812848 RepID=UPI003B42B222